MTEIENFKRTIYWNHPDHLCCGFGPLALVREPGSRYYDEASRDFWGVTWGFGTGDASGRRCVMPGHDVITDIENWRSQLQLPDLDAPIFDYAKAARDAAAVDRTQNLVCLNCTGGVFERSHFLLGFENCLAQMMLEQELMGELMDAVADVKIGLIRKSYEATHFDAIFFHDDWGAKDRLFSSPELWRTLIKPRHKKVVEAVKALGDGDVIFIHHSDTFLEPLIPDMIELGIDVWQGCIPQNDIVSLQKTYRGKIAFMGGIDIASVDRENYDEAEIRREVRRAVDTYAPLGGFIPGIPSGGALYPDVQRIIDNELESYKKTLSF